MAGLALYTSPRSGPRNLPIGGYAAGQAAGNPPGVIKPRPSAHFNLGLTAFLSVPESPALWVTGWQRLGTPHALRGQEPSTSLLTGNRGQGHAEGRRKLLAPGLPERQSFDSSTAARAKAKG